MALRTDRLRALREQHEWSQRELARLCGLGVTMINKYENGESDPSATNLQLIADQLDVSADYLLGRTDDPRGHVGDGQMNDEERAVLEAFRREGWPGILRLGADRLSK
jgi:transcriptional regulator with XRE-family HTH domain